MTTANRSQIDASDPLWPLHTMRPHRLRACLIVGVVFFAGAAAAGTHQKTATARSSHAGYTMTLSNDWVESGGYRPIRIVITPHKPPPADQVIEVNIDIEFRDMYYYRKWETLGVTERIKLPQGTKNPTSVVVWIPKANSWSRFSARFYESGTHLERLDVDEYVGSSGYGDNTSAMLVVSRQARSTGISNYGIGAFGNVNHPVIHRGIADCPDEWIGYSSFDVLCMTAGDLQFLVQTEPKRWQAIRAWVMAGGNLFISDPPTGQPPVRVGLPAVESVLGIPTSDESAKDPLQRGWQRCVAGAYEELPGDWRYRGGSVAVPQLDINVQKGQKLDYAVFRPWGQGTVVVAEKNVEPDVDSSACSEIYRSLGSKQTIGAYRTGVSSYMNPDFWKFLVPGVGQAPVFTFLILITLFCAGIGPLNYFLLRRNRRLHLLIVTVPAVAGMVTFGLFSWVLITDGLGVQVRARTLTEIDQSSGHAVAWSRLSYYAGLSPSGGLQFSRDVAVTPITAAMDEGGSKVRTFAWRDDLDESGEKKQHLQSGWLRSRMPIQFLTVRSRKSRHLLEIQENTSPDNAGEPPTVKNVLTTNVKHLLLCDGNGSQFYGKDIDRGATATLTSTDLAIRMDDMEAVFKQATPAAPPGVDTSDLNRGRYYYYMGNNSGMSADDGAMERRLAELRGVLQSHGRLKKRTYLAIVERSPEVEYGVASFSEVMSLHAIVGSY